MVQKKALVLLNMGAARSKDELKTFLLNMFNDKYILTIPIEIVRSFVATMITTSRLNSAWENYEEIGGQSPLHGITSSLVEKLQKQMPEYFVIECMRYTDPFAREVVEKIKEKGIKDVILLPLYPQYSTTTTQSSIEDFEDVANGQFNIQTIRPYYENSELNEIISNEIIEKIDNEDDFHLIFSAHGLPQKIVDKGDPYQIHVQEHVECIKTKLKEKGAKFASIKLAYQSKVGPLKWLDPSLDSALVPLKNEKVLIYPIAFMIENSETDFELSIEYEEIAQELGIKEYKVCSCPNDKDTTVNCLENLVRNICDK
jgi:ferrochelatase